MQRRSPGNNYKNPGFYHITITVHDRRSQSLCRIIGSTQAPDGHPDAPKVELTAIGKMVEYELLHSITKYYPVTEIEDYVIMPEHLHFIINVKHCLISKNGRETHLGQLIAGFKKGCNSRYWEIIGQGGVVAKPQTTTNTTVPSGGASSMPPGGASSVPSGGASSVPPAYRVAGGFATSAPVSGAKKPRFSSGRPPLFSSGYVDVIPLREGQLDAQRAYIHANPRNRLLRMSNRTTLHAQRYTADTLVSPNALRSYLMREHALQENDNQTWQAVLNRLLIANNHIHCDSFGDLLLMNHQLLPVVCHRKDKSFFPQQKQACLDAASNGAILVSARIAPGEQVIIDEAIAQNYPIILIADNGFPELYHPSETRLQRCDTHRLLLLTPWTYQYRPVNEDITVAQCKTMNCIVQAICKTKDDWWKKDQATVLVRR